MMDWNTVLISIQYSVTKALARKLADQGNAIEKKNSKELRTEKTELQTIWKGENSEAYLRKMDCLEQKITNNAKGIQESARVIEEIAYNFYRAELQAIEIAKNRGY